MVCSDIILPTTGPILSGTVTFTSTEDLRVVGTDKNDGARVILFVSDVIILGAVLSKLDGDTLCNKLGESLGIFVEELDFEGDPDTMSREEGINDGAEVGMKETEGALMPSALGFSLLKVVGASLGELLRSDGSDEVSPLGVRLGISLGTTSGSMVKYDDGSILFCGPGKPLGAAAGSTDGSDESSLLGFVLSTAIRSLTGADDGNDEGSLLGFRLKTTKDADVGFVVKDDDGSLLCVEVGTTIGAPVGSVDGNDDGSKLSFMRFKLGT